MTRKTKALVIALVLMVLAAGYLNRPQTAANQRKVQVYNACIKAHDEVVLDMFDENYCGALQDEYNMDFLCNQANTKCWVESR